MNKKYGLYIILGLIVGANFGILFAPVLENKALGIALGALGGVFVGWFVAAIIVERSKDKTKIDHQ